MVVLPDFFERKIMQHSDRFKLKALFFFFVANCALGSEPLNDIRKAALEDAYEFNSAKIVYVQDSIHSFDENSANEFAQLHNDLNLAIVEKINTTIKKKVDITLDKNQQRFKMESTDLRDIDKLLDEYELSNFYLVNIVKSSSILRQNEYTLNHFGKTKEKAGTLTVLNSLDNIDNYLKLVKLGTIEGEWINNESDIQFEVLENKQEKALLKITSSLKNQIHRHEIICDPEIDFKFLNYKLYSHDNLTREISASDYRMTDGVWFPFSYKEIRYKNGEVVFQVNREFEKVDLGAEINENDFTMQVPKGTYIVDTILGGPIEQIEKDCVYTIVNIQKYLIERFANLNEIVDTCVTDTVNSSSSELFIPSLEFGVKYEKPYVLDLDKFELIPFKKTDQSKQLSNQVNGDVAWDGKLILLSETSVKPSKNLSYKYTKMEEFSIIEWTDDHVFPSQLVLTTAKNQKYIFTIKEKKADGIVVSCQRI